MATNERGSTLADANRILAERRHAHARALADAGLTRSRTWSTDDNFGPRHTSAATVAEPAAADDNHLRRIEADARARARALSPTYGSPRRPRPLADLVSSLSVSLTPVKASGAVAAKSIAATAPAMPTARIHPQMLLQIAQAGDFAAARLHAILVALIRDGRGWINFTRAADALTRKSSTWYTYGRRRLAEVLSSGEGVFWTRSKTPSGDLRIWVKSRAHLVAHYGLTLAGREVTVPVAELVADAGAHGRGREAAVYATIYSAAHAGRTLFRRKVDKAGNAKIVRYSRPIARHKLAGALGISKGRQLRYEARRQVKVKKQIELLPDYSDHRLQMMQAERVAAWRHVDRRGVYSYIGRVFLAIRLPNIYKADGKRYQTIESTVNRRRINAHARRLLGIADLCHIANEGNGKPRRIFYQGHEYKSAENQASREIGRADAAPVYQPMRRRVGTKKSPNRVWPRAGAWRDVSQSRQSRLLAFSLSS